MKKILFILLISISCSNTYAQKKYFEQAIEKEVSNDTDLYRITNLADKRFTERDIRLYAEANALFVSNIYSKPRLRFGVYDSFVDQVVFLPIQKYERYLYGKVNDFATTHTSFKELKQDIWLLDYRYDRFKGVKAKWSGSVKNGKAEGKGVAFYKLSEDISKGFNYVYIYADFKAGIPQGKCRYIYINESEPNLHPKIEDYIRIEVKPMSDGLSAYKVLSDYDNPCWGFITADGTIAIKRRFEFIIQEFKNGQALVENKRYQTRDISIIGDFFIDKSGKKIDWGPKYKRKLAEEKRRQQEVERQQEAERQRQEVERLREEARREREAAEQERQYKIREAKRKREEANYRRRLIRKYGKENAEIILNHKVAIGFTLEMCKESLKYKSWHLKEKDRVWEVYKITDYFSGHSLLYFRDGVLEKIKQ